MKRVVLATGVVISAVMAPIGAVGAAGKTVRYESSSVGGNAILTTCTSATPIGSHCEAWVINADKTRSTDGRSSTVSVSVVDVEITEDGFVPLFRGSGSAAGSVSVSSKLASGQASASIPVSLDCTEAGCTETVIAVSLAWTGAGTPVRHSETSEDDDGTCRTKFAFKSTTRAATATGTVNGVSYPVTPQVFPPRLFTNESQWEARGCGDVPVRGAVERAGVDLESIFLPTA